MADSKSEIALKVRTLKKEIITPFTKLIEGSVPKIKHRKGFTNKDITSNHSTEYAYSTVMYRLMELVILDVVEGNIVYLDKQRKAKLYVDSMPAGQDIILGKNAENATIPLIDFRASRYTVPVMIFDTGYKASSLMQCFLPKYLYAALVDKVNTGKVYPKGIKVYWANKQDHGDRYKRLHSRTGSVLSGTR